MATAPVLDMNAYGQTDMVEERVEYPAEFLSWLQQEEERAKDTTLNDQRAVALSFYNGEPFGDEEDGRSQIVTRDVAEVIDYMVPSVLRTMVSGDRVVEFEALDEGFSEILEQATEAVSQQFMQEQEGWRILHDSLKSGLLEKTGAIKSYVEEKRTKREGAIEEALMRQMEGVEIVDPEPLDETQEQWRWYEVGPKFCDEPLPNEEFGVAPDARSLRDAVYYNHRTEKTLSEIREMGLDADLVGTQDGGYTETRLSDARDGDSRTGRDIVRTGPNRKVVFLEEYCRYDLNGDGITEFLRVQRVGTAILGTEEIEHGPCEEWCPFPMQHRRVGQSLADKVMDIQRSRSVMMRQAMDNLYQSNIPRVMVHEQSMGDSTIDDLLTVRAGALIRWTGTQEPKPWAVPFVAGTAFDAMEILAGERESRTGITRLNQGLDADTLNKTATGTALMQAAGQQIEEYIARNFAEFIGRVFEKKYRLMKDYGKPFPIIVDGQPVQVDPSQWPDEMRVMVRVGLGSGRKEQRIANRMLLLNLQKEAAQAQDPHVGPKQIFNSVKGLVADLQLGQATDYYADPDRMPPEEEGSEPPDPKLVEVQGRMQIEAQKVELDKEKAQAENQIKADQQRIDAMLKQQAADYDLQAKQERAALESQLARDKAGEEVRLAWARLQNERDLAFARLDLERETRQRSGEGAGLPKNRPGGDLDK